MNGLDPEALVGEGDPSSPLATGLALRSAVVAFCSLGNKGVICALQTVTNPNKRYKRPP